MSSFLLTPDGSVYSWGLSVFPQPAKKESAPGIPEKLNLPYAIIKISCGTNHVAALTKDGKVITWGMNSNEVLGRRPELGEGKTKGRLEAGLGEVEGLPRVKDVGCGSKHTLVLTEEGRVWSWGSNEEGQLGAGEREDGGRREEEGGEVREEGGRGGEGGGGRRGGSWEPLELPLEGIISIACGHCTSFALGEDWSLWAWGKDLGSSPSSFSPFPTRIKLPSPFPIAAVIGGWKRTHVLTEDGRVFLWGHVEGGKNRNFFCSPEHGMLIPNLKFTIPILCYTKKWDSTLMWIFLGKRDENSQFSLFPPEVVYHFICIEILV
jgi:alpha-tubulin suppressor-like RCC1 family protein